MVLSFRKPDEAAACLMRPDLARIPYVDGSSPAEQVADSAASIAAMPGAVGRDPVDDGEHVDIWNHVEAAMAMLVGGQVEAAERAWPDPDDAARRRLLPMKIVGGGRRTSAATST